MILSTLQLKYFQPCPLRMNSGLTFLVLSILMYVVNPISFYNYSIFIYVSEYIYIYISISIFIYLYISISVFIVNYISIVVNYKQFLVTEHFDPYI